MLDYNYFKKDKTTLGLNKQQELDADLKAILQINLTRNIANNALMFSITEKANKTVLDFSQKAVKVF